MTRQPEHLATGSTYGSADFGAPSQWGEHVLDHPRRGKVPGKTFLGQVLGLTGMEVSFGALAPGTSMPFLHAHKQNEELYVVLE
ncbi:MAG TPA: hypothetical protein VN436_03645, partial [Holophaga sp.]|nr:hypothetical protein [Holophaga sp.]